MSRVVDCPSVRVRTLPPSNSSPALSRIFVADAAVVLFAPI